MRDVSVEQFAGPLDLLLSLIEQDELDISRISLGNVTEQYIAALQEMEELPAEELADFLVIAAKLVLIKSRLLLPQQDIPEDDPGFELERQLRMYKAYVDASKHIEALYAQKKMIYVRDGYTLLEPIFNPPKHITADTMKELFQNVIKELEPIARLPHTVLIRTINIRETISKIRDRLVEQGKTSFHSLLKQTKNTSEAIITFLAVLELVKQRSATVSQAGLHQDMDIEFLPPEETNTQPIV